MKIQVSHPNIVINNAANGLYLIKNISYIPVNINLFWRFLVYAEYKRPLGILKWPLASTRLCRIEYLFLIR